MTSRGFSLMEVLIAVFLSSLLLTGIVQLLVSSASVYRLQLGQSQLEESSRYARTVLLSHISQAGYQPQPWISKNLIPAVTAESLDAYSARGDQLGLQRWSQTNCYGNDNSVTDSSGQPAFYLLQSRFRVVDKNNLTITCRYGPDASQLVTQINNYGLVENVENIQLLYAEDRDDDNIADIWVNAQQWQNETKIKAIKVALLIASSQPFEPAGSRQITLLDETISTNPDGHSRKVGIVFGAIRGRIR